MLIKVISLVSFLSLSISSLPAHSAVFNISSGDVIGLIAAINTANSNGQENTINLAPGKYILTAIDNDTIGPNGLPSVTSTLSLFGAGAETTSVERADGSPSFRLLHVAPAGRLNLEGLTLRGGFFGPVPLAGGGIFNAGVLTVNRSVIRDNRVSREGGAILNSGTLDLIDTTVRSNGGGLSAGGIFNLGSGILRVVRSTISHNIADASGGIRNDGIATIQESTVSDNMTLAIIGGLNNHGTMTIVNTTVANNRAGQQIGGISNSLSGILKIVNSTISGNNDRADVGGISNRAVIELQNSIVAGNFTRESAPFTAADCSGSITSFGNNIIGDLSDCGISLLPSDLTGDPGLGAFVDSGAPGTGRFPLLQTSQAIDAGNDTACPATDQLETPRHGRCDIGAVEFYPVVNDLLALANVKTDFDPTPVPNGPAGSFRIIAEFTNTGTQTIGHRFAEVVELAGENLLLNADRGAGGVGARLTLPNSASTPLLPGATETFEFIIGLQKEEPFTFFVNLLGDPEVSNTSVTRLEKQ